MDGRSTFAIINAELFDGTGSPAYQADVIIKDDRIKAVAPTGTLNLSAVEKRINADGLSLAPGFIDIHSHSDNLAISNPTGDSKITQGVTTEVVGNCGGSQALIFGNEKRLRYSMRNCDGLTDWDDMASYADSIDRHRTAINIVSLAGHNSIREIVMDMREGKPTASEMAAMQQILYDALQQGAAGLSSGLFYLPGKFSDTDEVCRLASVLKGTGKPYATHMRSESDDIREALREAFTIAGAGDGKLQISHFKICRRRNWHLIDEVLQMVEDARNSGLQVTADRYPYLYSSTGIRAEFPARWSRMPDLRDRLKDPVCYAELLHELTSVEDPVGVPFKDILLCRSDNPEFDRYNGMSVEDIGRAMGVPAGEAYIKLLIGTQITCSAAFKSMCEENLNRILAQDYVFCGSDGSAYPFDMGARKIHPRNFGAFPRFFHLAAKLAPPEKVIARMTSGPAEVMQIPERGIITPGYFADLVLFDRERLYAPSDFKDPHHLSEGVKQVFVAGGLAFTDEDIDRRGRFGRFIRIRNRNQK